MASGFKDSRVHANLCVSYHLFSFISMQRTIVCNEFDDETPSHRRKRHLLQDSRERSGFLEETNHIILFALRRDTMADIIVGQ